MPVQDFGHPHGFGAAKVGGYPVRLRGLGPLLAAVSTPTCAPVLVGTRLRGRDRELRARRL